LENDNLENREEEGTIFEVSRKTKKYVMKVGLNQLNIVSNSGHLYCTERHIIRLI